MKRTAITLTVLAVLAVGSYMVPAMQRMGDMKQSGDEQGPMCMCPMHMQMSKSMMATKMTATEDGGVMVLAGNKLMKYNKGLALVTETEIDTGMEQMQQKMQKMMQQCPMHQQMMKKMKQQQDKEQMQQKKQTMMKKMKQQQDEEQMQQKKQTMMQKCPMCQQMMKKKQQQVGDQIQNLGDQIQNR